MKIIKVSTELEMSVHEFPSGTIREHNKALCELIGNGCDLVEHVMPKRLYTELKMPCLEVLVDDQWVKTRMEMNLAREWYLVGTPYCGDLEYVWARIPE